VAPTSLTKRLAKGNMEETASIHLGNGHYRSILGHTPIDGVRGGTDEARSFDRLGSQQAW